MRILEIDRQRHWAGQQVRTYGLARRLRAGGDHVAFACTPGSGYERRAVEDGFPCFAFSMRGPSGIAMAALRLARLLGRERIDVIDAHGSVDHNLALLASRLAGNAVVVRTKHNHTRLHSRASLYTYARLTRRIIAISGFARDLLVGQGIPARLIDTIPSAIDTGAVAAATAATSRAAARERFGIPAGAFAIGTTSRPSPRKGLDVACRAGAALRAERPGEAMVYVAAGASAEEVAALAAGSGLEREAIRTPGFLERVTDLFPALDVFLLPSRDEALGVALLEAMAAGLPAVASAVGGVSEVVIDGRTGLLVPPGDDGALARAIARLRDDPDLARRLAGGGRAHVRERHDLESMAAATRRSFERALQG